ncbi:DNA processing protein DprA [Halioglobus japonicus]|nr:DNA processing protein DprA [Halioglobus japonicus]
MNVAKAKAAALAVDAIALSVDDEQYPPLLREIHDPPPVLYVRGDPGLLKDAQLAVVGSRRASPAALRVAQMLGGQFTQAGLHVCSGLALGIDGAAHRGALEAGGNSIAVMATGIDRIYPHRHRELATQLAQVGCVVTEFPPGTPPRRQNFPQRNRIISGLSLGVLVIEAALPSGSLITAGTALAQGREVFALPWSILHEGGRGCLQLIRDGAKMVFNVEDILEELGPLYSLQQDCFKTAGAAGSPEEPPAGELWLLDLVGFEVITLDELVQRSAKPVAQVMAALSALELAGQIARSGGGYIRC